MMFQHGMHWAAAIVGFAYWAVAPSYGQQLPPLPQGITGELKAKFQLGDIAQREGDFPKAVKTYIEAAERADHDNRDHARAAALLRGSIANIGWADSGKLDLPAKTERLKNSEASLQMAIEIGDSQQKVLGYTHLAGLYMSGRLKGKGPEEAVVQLLRITPDQLKANQRSVHYYNLGRAYELSNNPKQSVANYFKAVELDPTFTSALIHAMAVVRDAPPDIRQANVLLRHLFGQQLHAVAKDQLVSFLQLKSWAAHSDAADLFLWLVNAYVEVDLPPEKFRGLARAQAGKSRVRLGGRPTKLSDRQRLETIAANAMKWAAEQPAGSVARRNLETTAGLAGELVVAYTGEMAPSFDGNGWTRRFKLSSEAAEYRTRFAALLQTIGRQYYRSASRSNDGQPARDAQARFSAAWALDEQNLDAAVYAAAVLRDYKQEVDPRSVLTNQLVDRLFDIKNEAYRNAWDHTRDPDKWEAIIRFHKLLGGMFENQGRWGDDRDPRSAIFQWSWAIKAEDRIRNVVESHPRSPELREHLGLALARAKRKEEANQRFDEAISIRLEQEDFKNAALTHVTAAALHLSRQRLGKEIVGRLIGRLRPNGDLQLSSAGPLAVGPEGLLFAADPAASAVFALQRPPAPRTRDSSDDWLRRPRLGANLAKLVRADGGRVDKVHTMVADLRTREVFLSVGFQRHDKPTAAIVRVHSDGMQELPLSDLRSAKVDLLNSLSSEEGTSSSQMAYFEGHLLMSGMTRERNGGAYPTVRVVSFFEGPPSVGTRMNTFFGLKGVYDSATPMRRFAIQSLGGEIQLVGVFESPPSQPSAGWPLAMIPVAALQPNAVATTKTVAELLGDRDDRVRDILSYRARERQFIFLSTEGQGVLRIDTTKLADAQAIQQRVSSVTGLELTPIEGDTLNVDQMARWHNSQAIILRRIEGGELSLDLLRLP